MGIVCPRYYLQANGETTFPRHLEMFKNIITTVSMWTSQQGEHLWFLPFFQVGICMLNKACLNWTWYSMYLKPWLKSWPLHPTWLILSLSILSRVCDEWSMHHNCCPMHFLTTWRAKRLLWCMCLVLLRMKNVSILLLSWKMKCAIIWTIIYS